MARAQRNVLWYSRLEPAATGGCPILFRTLFRWRTRAEVGWVSCKSTSRKGTGLFLRKSAHVRELRTLNIIPHKPLQYIKFINESFKWEYFMRWTVCVCVDLLVEGDELVDYKLLYKFCSIYFIKLCIFWQPALSGTPILHGGLILVSCAGGPSFGIYGRKVSMRPNESLC